LSIFLSKNEKYFSFIQVIRTKQEQNKTNVLTLYFLRLGRGGDSRLEMSTLSPKHKIAFLKKFFAIFEKIFCHF